MCKPKKMTVQLYFIFDQIVQRETWLQSFHAATDSWAFIIWTSGLALPARSLRGPESETTDAYNLEAPCRCTVLLCTQEPVFTNRAHIFMRWCLLRFSEFLCYIKAKEGPKARQHCNRLAGDKRESYGSTCSQSPALKLSRLSSNWMKIETISSSLCWSIELEGCGFLC